MQVAAVGVSSASCARNSLLPFMSQRYLVVLLIATAIIIAFRKGACVAGRVCAPSARSAPYGLLPHITSAKTAEWALPLSLDRKNLMFFKQISKTNNRSGQWLSLYIA